VQAKGPHSGEEAAKRGRTNTALSAIDAQRKARVPGPGDTAAVAGTEARHCEAAEAADSAHDHCKTPWQKAISSPHPARTMLPNRHVANFANYAPKCRKYSSECWAVVYNLTSCRRGLPKSPGRNGSKSAVGRSLFTYFSVLRSRRLYWSALCASSASRMTTILDIFATLLRPILRLSQPKKSFRNSGQAPWINSQLS
jgi:hypothetical protein